MTSRITVILHPNTSRVDLALNDRMFNKEQYHFSRKIAPKGAEEILLNVLNDCTVGIDKASTSKNVLHLEISDGMLYREYIPAVLLAIKKWAEDSEYGPAIFCDDRRWAIEPEYTEDGFGTKNNPVRVQRNSVDLGVEYEVWEN